MKFVVYNVQQISFNFSLGVYSLSIGILLVLRRLAEHIILCVSVILKKIKQIFKKKAN